MSEISIDPSGVTTILTTQLEATDALDQTLSAMPAAPNGGLASELIAFLTSAAAEAAALAADSTRGVSAIAADIVEDLDLTDAEATEMINDFIDELDTP